MNPLVNFLIEVPCFTCDGKGLVFDCSCNFGDHWTQKITQTVVQLHNDRFPCGHSITATDFHLTKVSCPDCKGSGTQLNRVSWAWLQDQMRDISYDVHAKLHGEQHET